MTSPPNAGDLPPVSPARISPPALPRVFPRPRLQTLLEQNEDKKLVLIIGQAAQGKTTAAAWYFQNTLRPSIWINLDPGDSDPVNLFYLLVQAIKARLPETDLTHLFALPSGSMGPRDALSRYRGWAALLLKTLNQPLQIFLDGLDRLSVEAEAFRLLQVLIEEESSPLRFILLSRSYPPLGFEFQKLKVGRRALILENEDLAFSSREIEQFFQEIHGLSFTKDQTDRVYKATEGWIGGIILLTQCLEPLRGSSVADYLDHRLPDRFQKEVFQYFGKEAFSTLTPDEQDILVRSSIVDLLDAGILQVFFPEADSQSLLKRLARRNLFVKGFPDPSQGMIFSYHQLFRDYLRTMLHSRLSEAEIRKIHIQAGAYYEKKGENEAALQHYLQARSFPKAAALVKRIGLNLFRKARTADLSRWLEELPGPLIRKDPWLVLLRCLARRFFTVEENLIDFKKSASLFKKQGDLSGLLLGTAFLIEAETIWGKYSPGLIREAEELLKSIDPGLYLYEQAVLWSQIGLVNSIRVNSRRGYWACQKAYLLANQLGDPLLQAGALTHALTCLTALGEFRQAEQLLKEMDPLLWRFNQGEIRSFYFLSKILFLIFRGETEASLDLCEIFLEEAERQGLAQVYPLILFYKQMALVSARQYDPARQIHRQLLELALSMNNGFLSAVTKLFAGVSAYWAGNRSEARGLVDQAAALFADGDSRSEIQLYGSRLVRGLLADSPETRERAIRDTEEVLEYFQSDENSLLSTESHLALGLLYHDSDQPEPARRHLQSGLKLAQERGYRHFVLISPRDTARACLLTRELLEEGNNAAAYAASLIIQKFAREADEELETLSRHPHPPVSQKAWEMRRSLYRVNTPPLRIETFGGLRLYLRGKVIGKRDWNRLQPRRLLTAILSQKSSRIPKEVLIELLWPEEKRGVGEKNFKTTLARLRKSLEPGISKDFGSSYVHLHNNTVFLDEELCRVDVWQFLDLYQEGLAGEKRGDPKGAQESFSQAVDLYRGDFVPEERCALMVEFCREDLKAVYLDLLTRMACYHEQTGAFRKAVRFYQQALQADPLLEDACRGLMSLYAAKNLFNEALRVFESCRKSLKAALNTKPDPLTVALYQGIKERARKA